MFCDENKKSEKRRKKKVRLTLREKVLRKRNLLSLFAFILLIVLIILIFNLDVFPIKYSLGITISLLIVNILAFIFINLESKVIFKIIGILIIALTIIGSVLGIYYLNITNRFINNSFVSNTVNVKNTYYVLSKKTNALKDVDISGEISIYNEMTNLDKAVDRLKSKYNINEKYDNDLKDLFYDLENNITNFILIDRASYEIFFLVDDSLKKSDYSIVHEFDIYTEKEKKKDSGPDKFNVYIGGRDSVGLMDFNMIATVNVKTHEVVLTSIPKDYYIEVAGKNGGRDKLGFMSVYGSDTMRKSLEKVFDINIYYTVMVDTTSLEKAVDYVDGIDFCSDYAYITTYTSLDNTYGVEGEKLKIKKGCQRLDGIDALAVARRQPALKDGEMGRLENCQKILTALLNKLISTESLLHYDETLNTLESLYETDISKKMITDISRDFLTNNRKWNIQTQIVYGVETYGKVHLSNMSDLIVYPDQEQIVNARAKIAEVLK